MKQSANPAATVDITLRQFRRALKLLFGYWQHYSVTEAGATILATGNALSPTVESRVCRIASCKEATITVTVRIGDMLKVVGQTPWRQAVQASLNEHGQLEIDAIGRPQPVNAS